MACSGANNQSKEISKCLVEIARDRQHEAAHIVHRLTEQAEWVGCLMEKREFAEPDSPVSMAGLLVNPEIVESGTVDSDFFFSSAVF
jgi:hypothetical protein